MPSDRNLPTGAATRATTYDAGLRAFFQRVYNNLAMGLALTGAVSWLVASSPALMHFFFGNHLMALVIVFAPLLIMMFALRPSRIAAMTSGQMTGVFYGLSALFGISFATIFYLYSGQSIARVFFITAGTFAGTSILGYTTKKDLTSVGGFGMMGLMGVILVSVVNMFFHSSEVQFISSIVGVIAMVCLTAWDTQKFKEMYSSGAGRETNEKLAIMAALNLYLDFINLFQFLLNLMGNRR
jgi:uncharacterized protein